MMDEQEATLYSGARVRRSLKFFVSGRVIAAVCAFLATVLVVRELTINEYAAFVLAIGSPIVFGLICGLGMERVIPRFLPELHSQGKRHELANLSWMLLLARVLLLTPAFLALYLLWNLILQQVSIELPVSYLPLLIAYIVAFLVTKQTADTLQALLHNREASLATSADALTRLGTLYYFAWFDGLNLQTALWSYIAGAVVGGITGIVAMSSHLPLATDPARRGFGLPLNDLLKYSSHAYLHNLGGILLTPQALRIVCAPLLGATGTAALGFAQSMVEFFRRHLPVNFLIGMIEPILIGRYRETRNFGLLNSYASAILKVNLFLLLPFSCWLAMAGDSAIALVTGGKYLDSIWLLAGLLILLALEGHRTLLHVIIMAVDETWLLVLSQFWPNVLLVVLVSAVYIFGLQGLLAALAGIFLFVNIYLARLLRSKGHDYMLDVAGVARLGLLSLLAGCTGVLVDQAIDGIEGSLAAGIATLTIFLVGAYRFKAFSATERDIINRLIGRPVWLW